MAPEADLPGLILGCPSLWLWTAKDGRIPEASLTLSLSQTQDYSRQQENTIEDYLTLGPERLYPA